MMGDSPRLPWRARIRTKILVPSIALFTIFAIAVIINFTWTFTARTEAGLAQQLQRDGVLLDRILRDDEDRIALHARFMADMVRFSEQFPGTVTGRSILIYLLEYLKQENVETRVYSRADRQTEPYGELVRKGLLGIRTTALLETGGESDPQLTVASVSPIERTDGIGEVIVTSLSLDEERLGALKDKMGVDLGIIHGGRLVAATETDPACRQVINRMITEELQRGVLDNGESIISNIDCDQKPQKAIFRPLEVGFEHPAIYVLSVPLGEILAAKRRVMRDTVLTAGLVLLGVVLVYSVLVRRFTQPLRDLASATVRVGERDFGPEVVVTSADEVGELASSFNAMLGRLKESERELERLHKQEMERADRMATIGELASGIAHEVRNPLAGISGAIHLLQTDKALNEKRKEMLEEMLEQITRMDRLTHDLLAYSKPSPAKLVLSSMDRVLDSAIFLTSLTREGSPHTLLKEYDPRLPSIRVDPQKIQQVFLNILLNSIQASPDGGEITVKTTMREEGARREVVVEISDHGVGMSTETLERAVRPFFTTKQRGTGLGLSIAQQIMQSHGGRMRIDSESGKGTKFTLHFPV